MEEWTPVRQLGIRDHFGGWSAVEVGDRIHRGGRSKFGTEAGGGMVDSDGESEFFVTRMLSAPGETALRGTSAHCSIIDFT